MKMENTGGEIQAIYMKLERNAFYRSEGTSKLWEILNVKPKELNEGGFISIDKASRYQGKMEMFRGSDSWKFHAERMLADSSWLWNGKPSCKCFWFWKWCNNLPEYREDLSQGLLWQPAGSKHCSCLRRFCEVCFCCSLFVFFFCNYYNKTS